MSSSEQASASSLLGLSKAQSDIVEVTDIPELVAGGTESNFIPLSWNHPNYDFYNPAVLFDTIVFIHVGPPSCQKIFGMHKGLLCYHSSYLKAALTGPISEFAEAKDGAIKLEDENIETFERFNSWLYSGMFHAHWTMEQLLDMYIFAERRLIRRLQNALVNWMTTMTRHEALVMSTSQFNHAWKSTLKLRTFLVDAFIAEGNLSGAQALERGFLVAVVRRLGELYRQGHIEWPELNDDIHVMRIALPFEHACERYHIHEDEEPSCDEDMHCPRSLDR